MHRRAHYGGGGFNTQPPEGGWRLREPVLQHRRSFNTQPPEGGWFVSNLLK